MDKGYDKDKHEFASKAVKVFDELGHKALAYHLGSSVLDFQKVCEIIGGERVIAEDYHKALCELSERAHKLGYEEG